MKSARDIAVPVVLAIVVAVVLASGGCSGAQNTRGGSAGTTGSSAPDTVSVVVKDLRFTPPTVRVRVGGTVKWTNKDTTAHTSTSAAYNSEEPTKSPAGAWNSPIMNPGQSWSRRFDREGRFAYACSIHPYIKGTVVVVK